MSTTLHRGLPALALGLALGAGCNFRDPQLTDAGGGDDDAPIDGMGIDAAPNTVVGRAYYKLTTAAEGTVELPMDLTTTIIAALIPDSNEPSGYRTATGSGDAAGNFVINDVPDGQTYLFKFARAYFVTDRHVIDQHFELPSRYMPVGASGPTPVTFNLTQMQPFMAGAQQDVYDTIEIYSFAGGYQGFWDTAQNQQALTGEYDWSTGFGGTFSGAPLPNGEDVQILHTRSETVTSLFQRKVPITTVVDWFDAGAVTIPDLTGATISGAFTPTTMNRSLPLNYTRGNFDSAYPGNAQIAQVFYVLAHPVTVDYLFGATVLTVTFTDWTRSPLTTMNITQPYADPLPATWTRNLYENYQLARYILLPGTTTARAVIGGTERLRPLPSGAPVLTPVLQPPSMIRLEGQDAINGGKVAFDGVAPLTLSWAPVATAKVYTVNVLRVFANGNQTRTQSAASFTTAGTSIEIPAEVFSGSEYFAFTVTSVQTPADYDGGSITLNGLPNSFARVPTGMFRLSSLCGNSTPDTGEQCDTGGDSTTCDVDCSTRVCGDGYRNSTAGEMCDTVRDTLSCDSDCTLPACGDGHFNSQFEDCDDGNTTDEGNGCSNICKFNNQCGNNIVQLNELCDTGGQSATCNSDCTDAFCGDGQVNGAANEQCDLGPWNGQGIGCSGTCQNE